MCPGGPCSAAADHRYKPQLAAGSVPITASARSEHWSDPIRSDPSTAVNSRSLDHRYVPAHSRSGLPFLGTSRETISA